MSIQVVRARPGHYAEVGRICVEAYAAAGYFTGWGEDPDRDEDGYARELRDVAGRAEEAIVLVALEHLAGPGSANAVLGSITVARPGTDQAEIAGPGEYELRMLAVDLAHRGQGVAGALLDAAAVEARAEGAEALVLMSIEPPAAVERRYESRGYVPVPERNTHWDLAALARGEVQPLPVWRLVLTAAVR